MNKDIGILKIVLLVTASLFMIDLLIGFISVILDLPDTIAADFIIELLSAIIFIVLLKYAARGFFNENIFDNFNDKTGPLKVFIYGTVAICVVLLIEYVTKPIADILPRLEIFDQIYSEMFPVPSGYPELVLLFLSSTIITAVVEELFFRGFLYKALRRKYGISVSILILTIIFFLFHLNPQMLIFVVTANVVLCLAFEYSKSLSLPVFIHTGINAAALISILSDKM